MELDNDMHDVGSVVYFINPKDESVVPALIIEVIVRRKLNAKPTASYITNVITKAGLRDIELNPVDTKLFAGLDDVRSFMLEKTAKKIDQIIAYAEKLSQRLRPDINVAEINNVESQITELDSQKKEGHIVELPDGSVARLKT